jgi:hypothetical protein
VVLVPVLADGSPDWENRRKAVTRDVGPAGIGLECPAVEWETTALVLLGRLPDRSQAVLGLEVRNRRAVSPGVLRVGCAVGGFAEEILRAENLVPRFRPESLGFATHFPDEVLARWASTGVLQPVWLDRVLVCPRCQAVPTFRQGCGHCGAAWTTNDNLIHHFACAHVGPAEEFERGGELVCPKCRARRLVIGADYENLTGPHRCRNCGWSDGELEQVAQCLRCGNRYPAGQSRVLDLRGYRAQRLDPLALCTAP